MSPNLSPLAMAEWIEILFKPLISESARLSPLAMAEWIEIIFFFQLYHPFFVSASDGGVD